MTNPTTEPGLGGPTPASSGTDTVPDALADASPAAPPAASFDDAMREAELRVAEAHNRQIVEREAERRRVHLETTAKLREVEKGSEAHFELLALRQRWTLPLDDDDYVLWMQHHLLEQHGKAIADEASQKRRARAKQMARGPAIVIAIVAGLAVVAGIGWFLRGKAERGRAAPTASSEEAAAAPLDGAPTASPTPSAPAVTPVPEPKPAAPPPASAAAPSPSAADPAPAAAPPASVPAAASPAPKGAPPKPGSPKKDMWEREF